MAFLITRIGIVATVVLLGNSVVQVESAQGQSRRGFVTTAPSTVTGEERKAQEGLWVLEAQYKSLRMIPVEVTDPATGQKKQELIWYLVYKAVNRSIDVQTDDSDTKPANEFDELPGPAVFAPDFVLVTEDEGRQQIYRDEILPEAQAIINRRERQVFKNPVEVVGPIPPITREGVDPETVIYGVAIWRGIDPETDFFTVYMNGFSNGYQIIRGPDGQPVIQRRTLVQKYWRPGDEFDEDEREIRPLEPPTWVYRADDAKSAQ